MTVQPNRRLRNHPRIGIFAGSGTSHSWLWFVDIFDRMGFHEVAVLDEGMVRQGCLENLDVLAISGGDTLAVAKALGTAGAAHIRAFIEGGGCYIGACAGAYLAMNSSKPYLNDFNFAPVKITNLSKFLPACKHMPHKFSMAYGCDYVFHPVRESVHLTIPEGSIFAGVHSLTAPLYGGPGMIAGEGVEVLARYGDFTEKTVFLVDKTLATDTLIGNAAAVRVDRGKGCLYLFGPHFEHPRFPTANAIVHDAILRDARHTEKANGRPDTLHECLSVAATSELQLGLKRELSNARIVAAGLEMSSVRWLIGAKTYEPEKIRVFLEAMWRRMRPLGKHRRWYVGKDITAQITAHADETTVLLRRLKMQLDRGQDTLETARDIFLCLHHYTLAFFNIYFQTISESSHNLFAGVTIEKQNNALPAIP